MNGYMYRIENSDKREQRLDIAISRNYRHCPLQLPYRAHPRQRGGVTLHSRTGLARESGAASTFRIYIQQRTLRCKRSRGPRATEGGKIPIDTRVFAAVPEMACFDVCLGRA